MSLYTRAGDDGTTSLASGERVRKDAALIYAYGSLDEADAVLGLARVVVADGRVRAALVVLQELVAQAMGELAGGREGALVADDLEAVEAIIDNAADEAPAPAHFVRPGARLGSAALHLARATVRRAEREVVSVSALLPAGSLVLPVLNRLSDACFALALLEDAQA